MPASECEKIVKSIRNTQTDTCTSPVRSLKTHADIFSPVIVNLTDESFIGDFFPPIFKKGDGK